MKHKFRLLLFSCIGIVLFVWLYAIFPKQPQNTMISETFTNPSPSLEPTPQQFTHSSLYLLINAYRAEHELPALTVEQRLEQSAGYKLQDMIANKYYRHSDLNDTLPWTFFRQANYQYLAAGENLSFAINAPWQVLRAWTESPKHNEQLLHTQYRDMGVAIDCESFSSYPDGGCIVVLHLGRE